jgi:hypothetical protein
LPSNETENAFFSGDFRRGIEKFYGGKSLLLLETKATEGRQRGSEKRDRISGSSSHISASNNVWSGLSPRIIPEFRAETEVLPLDQAEFRHF